MTTTFQVRDGARILAFDGVLIAESSSERPDAPRWTELQLYRTDGGNYIVSRVGRSIVVHLPGCDKVFTDLPKFNEDHEGEDPAVVAYPHYCIDGPYDTDDLLMERTRFEGIQADSPVGVIEGLTSRSKGVSTLPRIATELLEEAAQKDQAIADEFYVSFVS